MKEAADMREEYDFSNAKRNPYAKKLKKQIAINIDTVDYFKKQSEVSNWCQTTKIPFLNPIHTPQTRINSWFIIS